MIEFDYASTCLGHSHLKQIVEHVQQTSAVGAALPQEHIICHALMVAHVEVASARLDSKSLKEESLVAMLKQDQSQAELAAAPKNS